MEVLLYWDEVKTGNLPDACLMCGEPGTYLTRRRLIVYRQRILYRLREWVEVELPYCPRHERRPFIAYGWPYPYDFTADGIRMRNVAPEFAEALEEHRDRAERHERWRRKKRAATREDPDRDEDDDEEDDLPPPRRPMAPRHPAPRPASGSGGVWLALGIVAAVTLLPVAGLGCLCVGSALFSRQAAPPMPPPGPGLPPLGPQGPAFGPPGPPFGPGPGGPPFGPQGPFK